MDKIINNSFAGKNVLITGSSRGLGLTMAKAFAENGATVVLHGRDEQRLMKSVQNMADSGYKVYSVQFDVTIQSDVIAGIAHVEEKIGAIDVLINNAGINIRDHFLTMSYENWNVVMETNLNGVFFVGQAAAIHMAKRKQGKIINICSLLSEVARPGIPAYTAAKGAVKMLTKAMAIDLSTYNIQVNGIGPGYFATEMNLPLKENKEFDAWLTKRTPMQRWGEEEELCSTALYLAGDGSNFVTGQIIYVDGGILSSL